MIYLKPSLDTRRKRKDDTYPVILRLSFNGKSRSIPTGIYCKPKEWNIDLNKIRLLSNDLKLASEKLQTLYFSYSRKILDFQQYQKFENSDVQSIKEYIIGKNNRDTTVSEFWKAEINRLESISNYGNARNYKSALGAINSMSSLNVPFHKIDYSWLINLECMLLIKDVKTNSIAVYMRTLRAVYNRAINLGLANSHDYPFKIYKIKVQKTTPRAMPINNLHKFFNLNLESGSVYFNSWNYGRLIFMLQGINFADLAMLTRENLKQGRLTYKRSKTHKIYSIQLLPLAEEILNYYISLERVTLLPILTNLEYANKACLQDRVGQQRKTCNKWLKRLGESSGISERLTTYVFRYSWANAAKSLGYSKDLIAEGLGHEYGNAVTGIYLNDFDEVLLDKMNFDILRSVLL